MLPGPATDRETLEGWQRWRTTRHDFVPAPRLDLAAYQALSPRRQALHDLHRAATHANLRLQETPMSRKVTTAMRARIQSNALKTKPTTRAGLMINGGGYQGKTETVCEAAAAFEDFWRDLHRELNPDAIPGTRDLHAPVAYVQTPVTAKPKSLCEAVLGFYSSPLGYRPTLPQLIRSVRDSLHAHGTRVLIIDDVTRLKMHREADQDTLDLLRSLMSMNVTLIMVGVGIPQSGLLREGRHDARTGQWIVTGRPGRFNDEAATQTQRRFDLIDLNPFDYSTPTAITAWTQHLTGIENQLRLLRTPHGMLTTGTMPEYLFGRTAGIVGLLERLIEDGCTEAIESGHEHLDIELLDRIDIDLGNDGHHAPAAGEIPTVPDNSRRRGRNRVFDDHGPAADQTAG
ncbi:ATP-binding protein [Spirillospora sp. NPDC048911]|uniref:ATP-binding protein n=1 Tax=Spirillospora sp. NPDC048911 TaxID=3364527 RepID=UPI00371E8A77